MSTNLARELPGDPRERVKYMLRYREYFSGTQHQTPDSFLREEIKSLGLDPDNYIFTPESEDDEDFPEPETVTEPIVKKSATKK